MADGMDVAECVRVLNRRTYLLSREASMRTLLRSTSHARTPRTSSASRTSASRRVGSRIELTTQNTGAVARRAGAQKSQDVFPVAATVPNRAPTEVTVVIGVSDVGVVVRAERSTTMAAEKDDAPSPVNGRERIPAPSPGGRPQTPIIRVVLGYVWAHLALVPVRRDRDHQPLWHYCVDARSRLRHMVGECAGRRVCAGVDPAGAVLTSDWSTLAYDLVPLV